METKCPSTDEWIKKTSDTHTHIMEYDLVIKQKEVLPFAITWMDPEVFMLSEIREKDNVYSHFYVKSKKN